MAKQTRRSASAQAQRTVKTSVILDVETHVRLAALAAMRGVPMSAVMAEAIAGAVGTVVVFDRGAKATGRADSPSQGRESATDAA